MIDLNATFGALSDPTRRAILGRLASGQLTVGELAEPFNISPPAISRHLRVLEAASLIVRERRGQHRVCRLDAEALSAASEWLDSYRRFWSESFDRLDQHLKRKKRRSK
jgi:DNA-binding transcriptional ArsR family regulator